jgi:hypothetical protein
MVSIFDLKDAESAFRESENLKVMKAVLNCRS